MNSDVKQSNINNLFMRKKIAAANWKMNHTLQTSEKFLEEFQELSKNIEISKKPCMIIFPPYTLLHEFKNRLKGKEISYGAQNLFHKENGAYTGEISAEMLADTGSEYVILGHSERRQYFGESNELLAEKINIAFKYNLIPIYCCGETLAEREKNIHFKIIEEQIKVGLFHLLNHEIKKCVIAYEPVWAIGTGKTATPQQAQEIHRFIRTLIEHRYGSDISEKISILYGGSIKSNNASELFSQPDIDGGLIGGASLAASDFFAIVNSF